MLLLYDIRSRADLMRVSGKERELAKVCTVLVVSCLSAKR